MDIVGVTGTSYTIPAAITADCGATFRVTVSDGSGSSTSIPATLTAKAAPGAPVIVSNPERNRVRPGETGTFSVTAQSATPMKYQWQTGTWTTTMVDIPGATAASYTTPVVTAGDVPSLFRCIVTNAAGNATSATEAMVIIKADGAKPLKTAPEKPSSGK